MNFLTISFKQLDEMLHQGKEIQLIDLREPMAYREGHIKGAVNIPHKRLMDHIDELSKDKLLVFYCGRGSTSMLVCRDLSRLGFRTANVANGFHVYRGEYFTAG